MRVVAGSAKGRLLRGPPKGATARPTSDKVREALFQILEPLELDLVLDLYAGTGAMGIEALSRGAGHAVMVERDRAMLKVLAQNVGDLGMTGRVTIVAGDVEAVLAGRAGGLARGSVGLALVDPPYGSGAQGPTLEALAPWLAPEGVVALEHASRDVPPEVVTGLIRTDTRRWGDTAVSFYVLGDTIRREREETR